MPRPLLLRIFQAEYAVPGALKAPGTATQVTFQPPWKVLCQGCGAVLFCLELNECGFLPGCISPALCFRPHCLQLGAVNSRKQFLNFIVKCWLFQILRNLTAVLLVAVCSPLNSNNNNNNNMDGGSECPASTSSVREQQTAHPPTCFPFSLLWRSRG